MGLNDGPIAPCSLYAYNIILLPRNAEAKSVQQTREAMPAQMRSGSAQIYIDRKGRPSGNAVFVSTDTNGTPGALNSAVLSALDLSVDDIMPKRPALKPGYCLVPIDKNRTVVFVVTVGRGPVDVALKENLANALRDNQLQDFKSLWIPLMGTGAGSLSQLKSLQLTLDALASSPWPSRDDVEIAISPTPQLTDVEVSQLRTTLNSHKAVQTPSKRADSKPRPKKKAPQAASSGAAESPAVEGIEALDTPANYVSRFHNDDPRMSPEDLISIADEVVAFSRLAASRTVPPPLSIGVFGDWGTGKSYFMERMHAEIKKISADVAHQKSDAFYTDIVQIRFNAWHYIETNLWASLVEYIFNELDRWLRARDYERPQVDALFERLATSRQLKLDAYRDLVTTRRALDAATQELNGTRTEYEDALKEAAIAPIANSWPKVAAAFIDSIGDDNKRSLQQAASDLGVPELKDSVDGLTTLVNDTRSQSARGRLIATALVARLGSAGGALVASGAVLAAPIVAAAAIAAAASMTRWQWVHDLKLGIVEIASGISAVVAVGGVWLNRVRKGLDTLDSLRDRLDKEAEQLAENERSRLASAEVAAERARQAIVEAEKRVVAAREREIAAKQDYESETASGRLNRFIRGKVADASYAKHLGIVASIRKDFSQLTDIMMHKDKVEGSDPFGEEIKESEELYAKKVKVLIETSPGLLKEDEIRDLQEENDQLPPSFERIILYIDDLDRCPPDKVVDVLQAIHLLLHFPLFVVVVAVDARWVSRSLKVRYKELLADERTVDPTNPAGAASSDPERQPADAQDYLEKIFQLPYWVRRMDAETSTKFIESLAKPLVQDDIPLPPSPAERSKNFNLSVPILTEPKTGTITAERTPSGNALNEEAKKGAHGEADLPNFIQMTLSEDEKRILSEFAPFVGGSPRRAKRFLNLYLLLKASLRPAASRSTRDRKIDERAVVALLAIVTGAYKPDAFFRALASLDSRTLGLASLLKLLESSTPMEPCEVVRKLIELNRRDNVALGSAMVLALRRLAPTVRRYSF